MAHKYFVCSLGVVLFFTFCFFSAFSQDTIRYYENNKLVEEVYFGESDKLPKSAFLFRFGFGFQRLIPDVYPTHLFASRFWGLGGQYRRVLATKNGISLGLGIELAWNNLRWQTDYFLSKSQDSISFVDLGAEKVHKNKLGIVSLSVPIIFYKTFEKNWRVGVGTYSDWRLQSFSRTAYSRVNEDFDTKNFSDFHLQSVRWGLQVEVKYKLLRIFTKYDFNSLFKNGKSQKTNLLTFGLGL